RRRGPPQRKNGLFIRAPFAARFTGKNLFSASVRRPVDVTVGPLDTRIHLFHEQKLLSEYSVRHCFEHELIERYINAMTTHASIRTSSGKVAWHRICFPLERY